MKNLKDSFEPLISIVLPVYNVEKYLERCLKTVIAQTYKNIEIILVNDGSTDGSLKICEEYKFADTRIKIINKENGGLSDARNVGIKNSAGEYITFIDSDDKVEFDYVEYLYNLIKNNHVDISVCAHTVVVEKTNNNFIVPTDDILLSDKIAIKNMLYSDKVDTSAWAKLYKKSLFNNIKYPEGMLFEDIATTYKLFMKAKKIIFGSQSKYNYIIRKDSITTQKFNKKKFDLIIMTDLMAKEVLKVYPDLYKAVMRRRVYSRFSTLNHMLSIKTHQKEKAEIIQFIKQHGWEVFRDSLTPFRDKVAILLLFIDYRLYKFVWELKKSS